MPVFLHGIESIKKFFICEIGFLRTLEKYWLWPKCT